MVIQKIYFSSSWQCLSLSEIHIQELYLLHDFVFTLSTAKGKSRHIVIILLTQQFPVVISYRAMNDKVQLISHQSQLHLKLMRNFGKQTMKVQMLDLNNDIFRVEFLLKHDK